MSFFSAGLSGMVNKRRNKLGKKAAKKGKRRSGYSRYVRPATRAVHRPNPFVYVSVLSSRLSRLPATPPHYRSKGGLGGEACNLKTRE